MRSGLKLTTVFVQLVTIFACGPAFSATSEKPLAIPTIDDKLDLVAQAMLTAFHYNKTAAIETGKEVESLKPCTLELFTNGKGHLTVGLTKYDGLNGPYKINPRSMNVSAESHKTKDYDYRNLEEVSFAKNSVSITTREGQFSKGIITFWQVTGNSITIELTEKHTVYPMSFTTVKDQIMCIFDLQ